MVLSDTLVSIREHGDVFEEVLQSGTGVQPVGLTDVLPDLQGELLTLGVDEKFLFVAGIGTMATWLPECLPGVFPITLHRRAPNSRRA